MLGSELTQLRGMALYVPVIFLAVAAFLLNVVLARLVELLGHAVERLREDAELITAGDGYAGGEIAARHGLPMLPKPYGYYELMSAVRQLCGTDSFRLN